MKPIAFPEQIVVFAENQPEYQPLPAHVRLGDDPEGRVVCCWGLSWRERFHVLWSGRVWHQVLTFNQRLQPQLLTVEKPVLGKRETR